MLGTDLQLYENCVDISIIYELDSYEEYTITDGVDGGLAIVRGQAEMAVHGF